MEIMKADPEARKQALLFIIAMAILGGCAIFGVTQYLDSINEWLLSDPRAYAGRLRIIFLGMAVFLSLPICGLSIWLWRLGADILAGERFPPAGWRIISDTPILKGPAASLKGYLCKGMAFFLTAMMLMLWFALWRLQEMLKL